MSSIVVFFLFLCCSYILDASTASQYYTTTTSSSRTLLASASIPRTFQSNNNNRRRSRNSGSNNNSNRLVNSYNNDNNHYYYWGNGVGATGASAVWLASTKKQERKKHKKAKSDTSVTELSLQQEQEQQQLEAAVSAAGYNNDDLGPIGKVIAGTVEIVVATGLEFVTGFTGGYFLGTVTGIPSLLFKTTATSAEQKIADWGWQKEVSKRFIRMNSKSFQWAKTWGGISAAFGCFRVGVKVIRNGKEDEWNTILSSAAAGAYFARKEGPQGMLRGAVMYGGLMYLLSGNKLGPKKQPFQYNDEPIDF